MMRQVKIGVIGCGAVAQVQHLPNLNQLHREFEVSIVCDISEGAAAAAARRFNVPKYVTDYTELLDSDAEAVLLCHRDPKTEVALAAFDAGKHVFIEKPVCFSLQELEKMIAAQQKVNKVAQAGYMKVYDPAFQIAKAEVDSMDSYRFVQINHLHPNNQLHLSQFNVERFDDVSQENLIPAQSAREAARIDAIGEVSTEAQRAFFLLSGSMIHDIYSLRMMLGPPSQVISAEVWSEGQGVSIVFGFPNGARCIATWVDLPDLWDFKETLEIYGDDKRVLVSYPTGFSRGILSEVVIQGIDKNGTTYSKTPKIEWVSAFVQELRHFHECITTDKTCYTPLESARLDIQLIINIVKCYVDRAPVKCEYG
ncbi:Gfo/Idh/MocA family oxidoreductase [Candidatus Poribacteria bacterium]|nr:Gfo/Idh/MocA family oxidoreductase [Candidatus Poribacteria bacterium]MYI94341.1 Gfo/Idh/MocA family oxidoreductase [Candidatus Poribacteria bacterium]